MSHIQLRPATVEDTLGWVECSAGLFAEDSGTRDPAMNQEWPRQHAAASLARGVDDPSRLLLVATTGETVAGTLSASLSQPGQIRPVTVATLLSMYVVPRQRRGGLGAHLVDAFKAWARERDADRIAVTAYDSNQDAIRFYQRCGFTPMSVTLEALAR